MSFLTLMTSPFLLLSIQYHFTGVNKKMLAIATSQINYIILYSFCKYFFQKMYQAILIIVFIEANYSKYLLQTSPLQLTKQFGHIPQAPRIVQTPNVLKLYR